LDVNTVDYNLPTHPRDLREDGTFRFPFAIHPLDVWQVTDHQNKFSEITKPPLEGKQYLQAQKTVVELSEPYVSRLLRLEKRSLEIAQPSTAFGRGRVAEKMSRLAPKHEGDFSGTFKNHDVWYVYTLVLRDLNGRAKAVKLGYSNNPSQRMDAHNTPMAPEITGFSWEIYSKQPMPDEDTARKIEQLILRQYDRFKLRSNGEILSGIDPQEVAVSIGVSARS